MVKGFRFKESELGIFKNVIDVKDAFKKHDRIIGFTDGKFSLIDLIKTILDEVGKSSIVIATWSAGIKDANQIKWMLDTQLISSVRLITDHSYVNRQKKYAVSITNLFGKENIRTSRIHAKFVLIYNKSFKCVITSSMNLNANRTCEIFEIDKSPEVFQFFKEFVEHTFDDMKIGFTADTFIANQSLKRFFNKGVEISSNWWDQIE